MDAIPPQHAVEIPAAVGRLRAYFDRGRTRSVKWRRSQLEALVRFLDEQEEALAEALARDLGKPRLEALSYEIRFTRSEAKVALRQLARWVRPERVSTPLLVQPGRSRIHSEPLGVVLIIAPWNFPIQLTLSPLLAALAAGNCAVLKPSELAPACSSLLAAELPNYFDTEAVCVVEGAVEETTILLAQRFDHILFTGGPRIARIVMRAAAEHLTPVTLELGGKCPAIVDSEANLEVAARRICWGKFANAGQVCLAPDHLLVHEQVYEPLISALQATVREFFGSDPKASADYGRIVNERHVRRLAGLLEGASIVTGGEVDEAARYVAPTLIRDVGEDSPLMAEEIFGPLLPIVKISSVDEAIAKINARPKPLAVYVFSANDEVCRAVVERTSSGGAVVNHCLMHAANPGLPFGGVGESGMGSYHGRFGFDTFSHRKAVLHKPTAIDPKLMYPPYSERSSELLELLM